MGEATRQGLVEGIEIPGEGEKGPGRAKVGGRAVRFWATAWQSEEASDVLEMLRKAHREGLSAHVVGDETTRDGPKGSYTQFMAKDVTVGARPAEGAVSGNGSSSPQETQKYVGREPGVEDNRAAARWALSAAIDVLGSGKEVAAYTDTASKFLDASLVLADSLAEKKEEADVPF